MTERDAEDPRPSPPSPEVVEGEGSAHRIVHLGLSVFHCAHQAFYTQRANEHLMAQGRQPWQIVAFTGRSGNATSRALQGTGGVFTLVSRAADGDHTERIESIGDVADGTDLDAWLAAVSDPAVAILSLTVTEKGYTLDAEGRLDLDRDDVRADLAWLRREQQDAPTTVIGRIVAGLRARYAAGGAPITVLSCDNLPANGDLTGAAVRALAARGAPELMDWLEQVSFPNAVVDRITPAPSAEQGGDQVSVITEPFTEWVISGQFPAGRPPWEVAGARFVTEIGPYENRKLWLLNSGHSLLAYLGMAQGSATVAEAMSDQRCLRALDQLWGDAALVLPLAPAETREYTQSLRERFSNPRIEHSLAKIATDGSAKLAVRSVPVVRAHLARGEVFPEGHAMLWAAWLHHLGTDWTAESDPPAAPVAALARSRPSAAAEALIRHLLPDDPLGDPARRALAAHLTALADGTGEASWPLAL